MWSLPFALAGGLALTHMMLRQHTDEGVVSRVGDRPEIIIAKDNPEPRLYVYRRSASGNQRLKDGATAARGDLVQLAYGGGGYVVVLSIDGARKVTLHWPERNDGDAPAVKAGENRLPSAYELDDAPAFERFFLVQRQDAVLGRDRAGGRAGARGSAVGAQPIAGAAARFRTDLARAREDARRKEGAPMTTRNPLPALAAALFLLFLVGVLLIATAATAAAATPPAAAPNPTVRLRRFVLLAGVDDGGPTRTKLRYAASDAHAMGRVLQTLGGVAPEDMVFVSTANRAAFDAAFTDIEQRLRAGTQPGVRRELLVYYSGHSDEDGLLVGRDRVGYDELRARVQRAPADLRVVILDSCASGAFTRRKGGVKRAPFLMDASSDMRGHAFLTSSAADERAQESDRIAASYFTYYLVSGLRGAADVNQDRRVTLQEAYQFASQETLARTERSQAGPQHAAYEFDLAGTGDMVVTDVRGTQSGLVLTPELGGRITVREANGALVAELRKPAGNTIELGLDPGAYVVAMDSGSTIFQANVSLTAGKHTPLAAAAFHAAGPREATVARGDDAPAQPGEPAATRRPPRRRPRRRNRRATSCRSFRPRATRAPTCTASRSASWPIGRSASMASSWPSPGRRPTSISWGCSSPTARTWRAATSTARRSRRAPTSSPATDAVCNWSAVATSPMAATSVRRSQAASTR